MTIEWVIPARLARSARPGFGSFSATEVSPAEVEAWLREARSLGIRSVLCLLDERQLDYYRRLPGGLLEEYRQAGLAVASVPVPDLQVPPISEADLNLVWRAFAELPSPLVIHCSAGIDRTGAAVDYILRRLGDP